MDKIRIAMIRDNLADIPERSLPDDYCFRTFEPGDERLWAEIQAAAGLFENIYKALERFESEFAPHLEEMVSRCFFIVHRQTGETAASGTAWYDLDFQGHNYGRLHWVAARPEHQGRGLGKPLVARLLRRLAESHDRAYLWTTHNCATAIRIYLDFGFEPILITERAEEAWQILAKQLGHPKLSRFLQ